MDDSLRVMTDGMGFHNLPALNDASVGGSEKMPVGRGQAAIARGRQFFWSVGVNVSGYISLPLAEMRVSRCACLGLEISYNLSSTYDSSGCMRKYL